MKNSYTACTLCSAYDNTYELPLCFTCIQKIKRALRPKYSHTPHKQFFEVISLFNYSPSISNLISKIKCQPNISHQLWNLILSLSDYLDSKALSGAELICSIPPNFVRSLQQSDLGLTFAMALRSAHNISMDSMLLRATTPFGPQQKFQDYSGRFKKLQTQKSMYCCCNKTRETKNIILVDDVCSTGATLIAAKKALEKSGYSVKRAIVLASSI